jgi:2-phosphoglycerate kinase
MNPPWTVTLVCGAAGVGKSTVATALARRYGTPLAEADDIVTALKAITTGDQLPLLHYWDTHPEAFSWGTDKIVELHFAVAEMLRPAFAAVIADHLEFGTPVVFEGDYLLPELVTGFEGAVRAVVLDEPDEDRIVANFRSREPGDGEQRGRARVTVRVGAHLAGRAARRGVPVVAAWPWTDVLERVDRALSAVPDRF